MNRSDTIGQLAAALAMAQAEMGGAKKDSINPHFRSKYADLASVWDACRPALTKHGIAVTQFTRPSEKEEVIVETMLLHKSGEWMSGETAIPVTKSDAQGFGSALTYARRYGLAAAAGVAPEDDDGNAASNARPVEMAESAKADWMAKLAEQTTKDALRTTLKSALAMAAQYGDVKSANELKSEAKRLAESISEPA